jgi:hypothetical protein
MKFKLRMRPRLGGEWNRAHFFMGFLLEEVDGKDRHLTGTYRF